MSHYPTNFNDPQGSYSAYGGVPQYYSQCSTDPCPSTSVMSGVGIVGPGSHVQDAISPPVLPSAAPPNNRGRKKQRKKHAVPEDALADVLKIEQTELNLGNEGAGIAALDVCDAGEIMSGDIYFPQMAEAPNPENPPLNNGNTLEQILSYKKMLFFQSPEIVELLKKYNPPK